MRFMPLPLLFPLEDVTISGNKTPIAGEKGGTAVKQAEAREQASLEARVARPLVFGTAGRWGPVSHADVARPPNSEAGGAAGLFPLL